MIQVDPKIQALLPSCSNHFSRMHDIVADGLFAKNVKSGIEACHGRKIVIGSVIGASRADRHHVQFLADVGQHLLDAVPFLDAVTLSGLIRALGENVAITEEFSSGIAQIDRSVRIPDASASDDGHFLDAGGRVCAQRVGSSINDEFGSAQIRVEPLHIAP